MTNWTTAWRETFQEKDFPETTTLGFTTIAMKQCLPVEACTSERIVRMAAVGTIGSENATNVVILGLGEN